MVKLGFCSRCCSKDLQAVVDGYCKFWVIREDGEIPSLPRSCEWERNLHEDHYPENFGMGR